MKKSKWIILISVIAVLVLAAVLLVVMLSDSMPWNEPSRNGDGSSTSDTSAVSDDDTTGSSGNEDSPEAIGPEGVEIEIDVDMGKDELEDDMVIDFDDLLAAAAGA